MPRFASSSTANRVGRTQQQQTAKQPASASIEQRLRQSASGYAFTDMNQSTSGADLVQALRLVREGTMATPEGAGKPVENGAAGATDAPPMAAPMPGPKPRQATQRQRLPDVPSSLFLFSDKNILRRFAIWFTSWPPFDWFILGAICANCVVMAMEEHLPRGDKKRLSLWLEELEPIFMLIFTFECLIKIIANGFILHKGSYLRNAWNILDFVVVLSGAIEMMPTEGTFLENVDLKSLRTVRVLRPLKLVSGLPSLQLVVKAILCALAPIMQIGVLLLFANVIFAIVGLEFYSGVFHNACIRRPGSDGSEWEFVEAEENIRPCHPLNVSGSHQCPPDTSCEPKWKGPNNGITSFDNIAFAMLTVFQCVSMEGWADEAMGDQWNWMFFVPLIVIGSFFMLNLVLGVLSGEFAKERERVENKNNFMDLRAQQQFERELTAYLDWINKAEDLVLTEPRTTREEKRSINDSRKRVEMLRQRLLTQDDDKQNEVVEDPIEEEYDDEEDEEADMPGGNGGEADGPPRRRQKTFRERMKIAIKLHRIKARKTVKTSVFYWSVIALVFLNTVTTAVEHYGQPQWLTDFLQISNIVFLTIFIGEMLFKMFALGLSHYWKSSFNKFDCLVIAGSTFELVYSFLEGASFGISVMRVLRLLRMFKMTPYWISLKNLVTSLLNSIKNIMSLLVLLFIFILIFALLGMQMFGGRFNFDDGRPFYHFDTFPVACITVFQIITAEDWNAVMYTAIDAQGGIEGGGLIFSIYFVFIMLLGNYTLLNVFLAIAVDNLATAQEMTTRMNQEAAMLAEEKERLENEDDMPDDDDDTEHEVEQNGKIEHVPVDDDDDDDLNDDDENAMAPVVPYNSLFLMESDNCFRVAVHRVVQHRYFETFILIVIIMSSIAMAMEDPVDLDSQVNLILGYFDPVFTFVFAMEMYLKIIDMGFVLHYGAYLRDFWNVLDFIVVAGAQFSMAVTTFGSEETVKKMSILKTIRVLRVLRPLKTIKRIPKLKAVFDCVVTSVKNVFNILIVYYIFQFIFAVIAVQLYKGKFFYCTDRTKKFVEYCQGYYLVYDAQEELPVVEEREWLQEDFNYDSTLQALLTLFVVTTGEGWPGIRQTSMDATEIDKGPSPFFRIEMALYYVLFFILFPFFFVNIFVALIIITFQDQGNDEYEEMLEKNEKQCIEYAMNAKPKSLYMPENKESNEYKMWLVVTSPVFEWVIMASIVVNTFILMMKFYGQPMFLTQALGYINVFLIIVFTVEFVLKFYAYGPANYMRDGWNKFDFITVVGSIVDLVATELELGFINLSFLRLFKAARLVRLLQKGENIRILLWTFLQSFKALPYVCLLIAMLFFIYAIIGMQLFGNMYHDPDTPINRLNNFQYFVKALMLLFRCATGEAWHEIMIYCLYGAPCADPEGGMDEDKGNTCGSSASVAYFVSFVFLSSFLMLNLFVAVIMDNFDYLTRDSSILGAHHLPEFITAWSIYDPAATGRVHYTDMYKILRDIPPPLGFGNKCPYKVAYKHLIRMNMPVDDNGTVHFTTTLFALIREGLDIKIRDIDEMNEADEELRAIMKTLFPLHVKKNTVDLALPGNNDLSYQKLTCGKIYSAKLIVECRHAKLVGEAQTNSSKKAGSEAPPSPSATSMDFTDPTMANGQVQHLTAPSGEEVGWKEQLTNNALPAPGIDMKRDSVVPPSDISAGGGQSPGHSRALLNVRRESLGWEKVEHSAEASATDDVDWSDNQLLSPPIVGQAIQSPQPWQQQPPHVTVTTTAPGVHWNPHTSVIAYDNPAAEFDADDFVDYSSYGDHHSSISMVPSPSYNNMIPPSNLWPRPPPSPSPAPRHNAQTWKYGADNTAFVYDEPLRPLHLEPTAEATSFEYPTPVQESHGDMVTSFEHPIPTRPGAAYAAASVFAVPLTSSLMPRFSSALATHAATSFQYPEPVPADTSALHHRPPYPEPLFELNVHQLPATTTAASSHMLPSFHSTALAAFATTNANRHNNSMNNNNLHPSGIYNNNHNNHNNMALQVYNHNNNSNINQNNVGANTFNNGSNGQPQPPPYPTSSRRPPLMRSQTVRPNNNSYSTTDTSLMSSPGQASSATPVALPAERAVSLSNVTSFNRPQPVSRLTIDAELPRVGVTPRVTTASGNVSNAQAKAVDARALMRHADLDRARSFLTVTAQPARGTLGRARSVDVPSTRHRQHDDLGQMASLV